MGKNSLIHSGDFLQKACVSFYIVSLHLLQIQVFIERSVQCSWNYSSEPIIFGITYAENEGVFSNHCLCNLGLESSPWLVGAPTMEASNPSMEFFVGDLPGDNYDKEASAAALRVEEDKGGIRDNVSQNLLIFAGYLDYNHAYGT